MYFLWFCHTIISLSAAEAADKLRNRLRTTNRNLTPLNLPGIGGIRLLDDSPQCSRGKSEEGDDGEVVINDHNLDKRVNTRSCSKIGSVNSTDFCGSTQRGNSPRWLVDPLRLTVRWPNRSALEIDDKICEGVVYDILLVGSSCFISLAGYYEY